MNRKQSLLASAALVLIALPATAQQRGGGGGRGGPPPGGGRGAPAPVVRSGGNFGNPGNFSRAPSTNFGITLGSPRSGLSFSYGTGGYGNFGGVGYGGAYRPYYGGGYGSGFGYGGYNNGFYSPSLVVPQSYIIPRSYVVPQTTYVVPQTTYVTPVAPVQTVAPAVSAEPATPSEMGLLITELKAQGTAKGAGLRQGDVILAIDGKRIQNFDELRVVLTTAGKKQANVEYIDGSNGQIEKKDVGVVDGKMGITIEEVPLKRGE